ncbi:PEP-CTERM sorting domain-containing protein [Phragmitibacter flavus]|uniref:PEP-CTERM sorting domain-containing protein n=1 Tax=Phragmitibacter flavus TaxID=2576071 RepID=UPI00140ADB5C|nr:PEP-CTERM sorting domain-containing protein [Phragmitibacter flavus]
MVSTSLPGVCSVIGSLLLFAAGGLQVATAQVAETLIDLTFSPGNAGDVAFHPDVSSVDPWTNGSETLSDPFGSGLYYMPDPDFGNGYAGLTVPPARFGFMWGFEGGFTLSSTQDWIVHEISFDYDVLGHNGEASLAIDLGTWSGNAPLPSTGPAGSGPNFTPVAVGERATGTVTFDFYNQTLTVTRDGYSDYTESFLDTHSLGTGFHGIDILVSNTAPSVAPAWDVNADSSGGTDGFYRIDNFQVRALQVPEPSSALAVVMGVGLLFMRRQRVRA